MLPAGLRRGKIINHSRGTRRESQNEQEEFQQLNVTYREATSGKVAAFSANWPYVTFSGMDDHLVVINAYEPEVLHRVQVFDEK